MSQTANWSLTLRQRCGYRHAVSTGYFASPGRSPTGVEQVDRIYIAEALSYRRQAPRN